MSPIKVVDNRPTAPAAFGMLGLGTIFKFADQQLSRLYVKIYRFQEQTAVDTVSWSTVCVMDDRPVIPVDATLTLDG